MKETLNSQNLVKKIITREHSKDSNSNDKCELHDMPVLFRNFVTQKDYCVVCKIRDKFLFEIDERKKRIEEARLQRKSEIEGYLNLANIPERFKDKTFKNYKITSNKQRDIVDRIQTFIKKPNRVGLIMIGSMGTGKNHLAIALLKEIINKTVQKSIITEASKIIRSIKDSWVDKSKTEKEVLESYTQPYLLIIDEIGVQFGSETEKQYLTEIINDRYNAMKPTILIGNLKIKEIEDLLGDRVIDRFKEGGEVLVFDWESYRGKNLRN